MKLTKILLILLFFCFPFIHGRILQTLWIDIYFAVSWNFEFSKALFLNIFTSLVFVSFIIEHIFIAKNTLKVAHARIFAWVTFILIVSTIFSLSPFISLIWDLEKWHTLLAYFNLSLIYIILSNCEKKTIESLIRVSIFSGICVSMLAIKELYIPSFHYGALASRALWSFWHPNYLAWYLLVILPFIPSITNTLLRQISIFIVVVTILLAQSIVALTLTIWFLVYYYLWAKKKISKKIWLCSTLWVSILWCFIVTLYFPEKLHSFLSRFYLWESSLRIIFSDIKIFLIWWWAETLPYLFDSFKVPQVYIFENYGFTADRPHSIYLNIFYHFWVLGLSLFGYCLYLYIKNFKNTPENIAFFLLLLFGIFHYFSLASYLVILICIIHRNQGPVREFPVYISRILACVLVIIGLLWAYYSKQLYLAEILSAEKRYSQAEAAFSHPKYLIKNEKFTQAEKRENLISVKNIKAQILMQNNKDSLCKLLTHTYPSAENYFYCGNIFDELWNTETSKKYYTLWLTKLPDLWNDDSLYWDNYFVAKTITGNRFFSEKFWDIHSILKKVWESVE